MPVDYNIILIKEYKYRYSAFCGACLPLCHLCKYRAVISCEDACKAKMIMLMLVLSCLPYCFILFIFSLH